MAMNRVFWKHKKLHDLTRDEWEALCDHCGKCCLHKIEDEETGKIFFTYVACKYLHIETCTCIHYDIRFEKNPDCIRLQPDVLIKYHWLPDTCAYRLIAEGKNLPMWHPLINGNPNSTQEAQKSVAHIAIPEKEVDVLEKYIIIEI